MHIRSIGFFSMLIISLSEISRAQSGYDVYHTQVNAAQRCMFLNDNYDSARFYYDKTFSSYDFCFLQDCVLAAELAMLHKDTLSTFRYITKGFENGLRPHHLLTLTYAPSTNSRVTLFDALLSDVHVYNQLKVRCDSLRPKYLSRINKEVRKRINEIYVYDQVAKAYANPKFMTAQSHFPYPEDKFASLYDSLISTVGYPGPKLIGIDDTGLANSLGMPEEDPIAIFKRYHSTDSSINHVAEKAIHIYSDLSSHQSHVCYRRNSCSYSNFQPYMIAQVKAGNIHPREAAGLLRKAYYQYVHARCQYQEDLIPYFFPSDHDTTYLQYKLGSDQKRARIYICSNEVEFAGLAYEKKYHIQFCHSH